jgi:hypothetical protein
MEPAEAVCRRMRQPHGPRGSAVLRGQLFANWHHLGPSLAGAAAFVTGLFQSNSHKLYAAIKLLFLWQKNTFAACFLQAAKQQALLRNAAVAHFKCMHARCNSRPGQQAGLILWRFWVWGEGAEASLQVVTSTQ